MSDPNISYGQLYGDPSPFPPSFQGSPLSYGFGLFGDVLAGSLSLAILLAYLIEARRRRQVDAAVHNMLAPTVIPRWSPLWFYLTGQKMFLTCVVMRTLPDALWMLAWGEVSRGTIEFMLRLDLVCDGVAVIPLVLASLAWAWSRQVIPQMLTQRGLETVKGRPPWDVIKKNGRIVLVVSVIAFLVTIGKASA